MVLCISELRIGMKFLLYADDIARAKTWHKIAGVYMLMTLEVHIFRVYNW